MKPITRALVFSYSDSLHYFAGTTEEPEGVSDAVNYIKDADGKPRKFPSLDRAKRSLMEMGFDQGWLVMQSPYDEMVGNEQAQKSELPLVFAEDK